MGGGGVIIIRNKVAETAGLETVLEQLGPLKRAKLEALLTAGCAGWTHQQFHFVLKCIAQAHEAYE